MFYIERFIMNYIENQKNLSYKTFTYYGWGTYGKIEKD